MILSKCLLKEKPGQGDLSPLPHFPRLYIEGMFEGTRKGEKQREPGLENRKTWKTKELRMALESVQ